jgi:hypothetical protein
MEVKQKMQPGIYYDEKTKTYYVSRRYKDWKGENKRLFKRGFKTVREAKQEPENTINKEDTTYAFTRGTEYYGGKK